MKTIKLFVFTILSVLLLSKVTLAQGPIMYVYGNDIYFDDDYSFVYEWVNFFNVHIERKSSPASIYIQNYGNSPLIISDIHIVGEGFRLINNETTITIEPASSATPGYYLEIEFAPTVAKDYKGTITFTHNADNLPSPYSMPIVGTGLPFGTPILAIQRDEFENLESTYWNSVKGLVIPPSSKVPIGKTEQYSILLYNVGSGSLVISSININSFNNIPVPFRLSESNSKTPIIIEPDSPYNLIIEFTPLEERGYHSILLIEHNGVQYTFYNPGNIVNRWGEINIHGGGIIKQVSSTDEPTELPLAYSLSQNYPNPFNPTTKIEYSLPEAANVRLAVYNSLGQEVASLVNEYQSIGKYIIDFNANNLPSGIYFYKIQAGNFNKTQKMVLMK